MYGRSPLRLDLGSYQHKCDLCDRFFKAATEIALLEFLSSPVAGASINTFRGRYCHSSQRAIHLILWTLSREREDSMVDESPWKRKRSDDAEKHEHRSAQQWQAGGGQHNRLDRVIHSDNRQGDSKCTSRSPVCFARPSGGEQGRELNERWKV